VDNAFTNVYAGDVLQYRFNDESYAAIGRAGVSWQSVVDVLNAHPQVRHPINGVLRVAAPDRFNKWYVVILAEDAEEDDVFDVMSARALDPREIEALKAILRKGRDHDDF
jgi:hypothetical protein